MSDPTALYEEKAELLKALAHPLRLRIVRGLLKCGCRNVGCMEANTGQSQSCISQHLMRLKAAGWSRPPGRATRYTMKLPTRRWRRCSPPSSATGRRNTSV